VAGNDDLGVGGQVFEAEGVFFQVDGPVEVAEFVFGVGERAEGLGERGDVVGGLEDAAAAPQQVPGLGRAAEPQQRPIVVGRGVGLFDVCGTAAAFGVEDFGVEVEGPLQLLQIPRGDGAGVEDGFADVPWGDRAVVRVGEGGHGGAVLVDFVEDLLIVALQAEDMQPPALVDELAPGPRPARRV
jgi:hypothetical protein